MIDQSFVYSNVTKIISNDHEWLEPITTILTHMRVSCLFLFYSSHVLIPTFLFCSFQFHMSISHPFFFLFLFLHSVSAIIWEFSFFLFPILSFSFFFRFFSPWDSISLNERYRIVTDGLDHCQEQVFLRTHERVPWLTGRPVAFILQRHVLRNPSWFSIYTHTCHLSTYVN